MNIYEEQPKDPRREDFSTLAKVSKNDRMRLQTNGGEE